MQGTPVPRAGPLSVGCIYQRSALHERFGGNQTAGIVPSTVEPVVLLFHTKEGAQQFYGDGFDDDGVYWYSGMGALGDMDWNHANRAVRDHADESRDLLLFERVQRTGGYWQLTHQMYYLTHKVEERPDREGTRRSAIIFGLVSVDESEEVTAAPTDIRTLRAAATAVNGETAVVARIRNVYARSAAVRAYALARAAGVCESCGQPAPFQTQDGQPFLESHHLDRLADSGPDRPERVAGICPNCHRRCHYGADARAFNDALRLRVAAAEAAIVGSSTPRLDGQP